MESTRTPPPVRDFLGSSVLIAAALSPHGSAATVDHAKVEQLLEQSTHWIRLTKDAS